MTVVDSSAIVAILLQEPEARAYAIFLETEVQLIISAISVVETGVVALRRGGHPLLRDFDLIMAEIPFEIAPVSAERAQAAIAAYSRFGRGIGRPACLTFGDCFAYALAKELDQPLLYKGDDFGRTDIHPAF